MEHAGSRAADGLTRASMRIYLKLRLRGCTGNHGCSQNSTALYEDRDSDSWIPPILRNTAPSQVSCGIGVSAETGAGASFGGACVVSSERLQGCW
jgi:hypothetical protein